MPLDLQRIQALCFDVDGTLSDTDDVYERRFTRWTSRIPLVREPQKLARRLVMWMENPGTALMGLGDRLGLDGVVIPAIDWLHRNVKQKPMDCLVVPGVAEMLPRLKGRFPLAAISARDEHHTMLFMDECGLTPYFDFILTALSARHTKPYPDPILMAAKLMNVKPADCLMIGDTTVDIRAGKSAGAQTVGVLCGFGEEAELRQLGADLIIPSTADIEHVLAAHSA